MKTVRLLYYSHMAKPLLYSEIEQLAAHADCNNRQRGITSFLACSPEHFLHALEVPPWGCKPLND